MTDVLRCPSCGAPVTMPTFEQVTIDMRDGLTACAVADPGTFHAHLRDEHPERWQEACEWRRRMNASGQLGLPRTVSGRLLLPGEDVTCI